MTSPPFDVAPYIGLAEGQHFERKSLFDGPDKRKKPRDRATARADVARNVAAFANAEGGVLILGLEDDGTLSGHQYPKTVVNEILKTPRTRLEPAQAEGFRVEYQGVELLVFDVAASDGPVMMIGDGYPLRIGDSTVMASEAKIRALKFQGLAESWESRPSTSRLDALDHELIERAKRGAGLSSLSPEDYLLRRKLADRRGRELVLRNAAELLFARDGSEHPNGGIRLFRVVGTERRFGPEHNVEERPRMEGPLPTILDQAFSTIGGLLRKPSRLVGNRFRETPEYPEFAWREAILNAVAHRDYGVQGHTTEVYLFDDRMEVTSPGGLLKDLTLEAILSLDRVHQSRNPRLVRVLVDLGYMRDQGEGIPRVFAEMEGLFLPEPAIEVDDRSFRLVLRNTPTLRQADREFIASLGSEELSDTEFRALLEAFRHGKVDNAHMRRVAGLDTLGSSVLLRKLRDRGFLTLHGAGSKSYFELTNRQPDSVVEGSQGLEFPPEGQDLGAQGLEFPPEGQDLDAQGQESTDDGRAEVAKPQTLPAELSAELAQLGERASPEKLRKLIVKVLSLGPHDATSLGRLLNRDPEVLVRKHLTPMVHEGSIALLYPDQPNDPRQAYRVTSGPLFETGTTGEEPK